ncbi:hypothetical protein CDEST_12148 [Colletotrichum destructivum]|uniref:Uncharacterized protein n=1 Tax=Colletotrichum destructivum TaxID=34406 RepID=A0AAX4IV32_9PEZI|nr:hypothetical protein CDEST_12148 [Colletotrichum destructivum]
MCSSWQLEMADLAALLSLSVGAVNLVAFQAIGRWFGVVFDVHGQLSQLRARPLKTLDRLLVMRGHGFAFP